MKPQRVNATEESTPGRAAEALERGQVIVVPTETVYGWAAMANRPEALAVLARLARGVVALDATAQGKTRVVDPSGGDVPDPIGQGPAAYLTTAQKLDEFIRARLNELAQGGTRA